MAKPRRAALAAGAAAVVVVVGVGVVVAISRHGPRAPVHHGPTAAQRLLAKERSIVHSTQAAIGFALPESSGAPAPPATLPATAFSPPLPRHQVLGFVPWYDTSSLVPADFADMTTIAYDGVDVGLGGALIRTDLAWAHYGDGAFASVVAQAHAAHDKAILTVFTDGRGPVDSLARHPVSSAATLSAQLLPLLRTAGLDGVDIDVEGRWRADRVGFVSFVAPHGRDVRAADTTAVFVHDTYVQSAADLTNFFDAKALARLVDALFVMAYDMQDPTAASPNAPLASPTLGLSDVQTLLEYTKVVPPAKLILGVPFYGYDFPTRSATRGARTSKGYPVAVTWSQIAAAGHPALWDAASLTPWYGFRTGRQWHQTWFDDPASVALKTALAAHFGLAGVGVWALGMENGDPSMLAALLGGAAPVKLP